jgi:hypothetical protein
MAKTAAARLDGFESRAQYSPEDALIHINSGWRYIAIHPFADDHQLLERLNWPSDRCQNIDAYWECAGDVYFVQMVAAGQSLRAPGFYYQWAGNDDYAANLVAVVESGPIVRQAFESVMSRFARALPLLGRARKLSAVPEL